MRKIGMTGGIGAGKSELLAFLEKEYGAFVIQADREGHIVMEPGGECYDQVIGLFGHGVVNEDRTLKRKAISDIVFRQEDMLKKLNAIIHPAVRKRIQDKIAMQEERGQKLLVVESALAFEDHYEQFLDEIWFVYADRETRIRRLMENRGYSREKCMEIMDCQCSDQVYRESSDVVIDNSNSIEDTCSQIRALLGEKGKYRV